MKRKKQGASLILLVIVFMFISTVSLAMLSMVASNYKGRVVESKRVENLYASDSGLDIADNIIGKTFDAATKYAYYEVEALKSDEGNPKSFNYVKYENIKQDIINLNKQIDDLNQQIAALKREKSTPYTENLIIQNNKLIVQKKSLIEEDENLKQILLNEEFKRTFKNFIARTSELGVNEVPPDELERLIEGTQYVSESNFANNEKTINFNGQTVDFDKVTIDLGIKNKNNKPPSLEAEISLTNIPAGSLDEPVTITAGHSDILNGLQISKSANKEYDITVTSTFYTETVKLSSNSEKTTNTNERILKANFRMSVPNYKDIYFENTTGELQEYLALKDRALTVFGDMNINGADKLNVDGEIFVEGKEPAISTSNRTFEKYNGGIIIADSNEVTFNDDVVTRKTFNVREGVTATVAGNLYGRNVYMGGSINNGLNDFATNSTLNLNNEVVIDNDLSLKAYKSAINIKHFYGINDKTIDATDANGVQVDKVKTASSIIVNSYDKSAINITKTAYIMGTAHINTNEKNDGTDSNRYQTGESTAVKGNYKAYTVPIPIDNTTEQFKYYDPLQLLDEDNVITKAKHFADYWKDQIDKENYPDTGGIHLPVKADKTIDTDNIWSIGALVYEIDDNDGNKHKYVMDSPYYTSLERQNIVYERQKRFASKVYKFNQYATKEYEYDKTIVTDFNSLVNFNTFNTAEIQSKYDLTSQTNKGEYAIFNGDSSKEIKIITYDGDKDVIDPNDPDNPNSIVIKVSRKDTGYYTLNAVIASAGKISIGANIKINGCIIDDNDLDITGENVTIKYDSGVIERVQLQNAIPVKALFGDSILMDQIASPPSTADSASSNYDLKKFLEKKLWKIFK